VVSVLAFALQISAFPCPHFPGKTLVYHPARSTLAGRRAGAFPDQRRTEPVRLLPKHIPAAPRSYLVRPGVWVQLLVLPGVLRPPDRKRLRCVRLRVEEPE